MSIIYTYQTHLVDLTLNSRRNFEGDQRVVEGLEVVKTFRVLDGVAGTEYPTSTIRSQLRLTRPRGDDTDIPSGAF